MGEGPRQIFRYQIQVGDIEETERGESGLKIMCTGESYKMSYRVRAMESVRGRCIFAQTREVEREREFSIWFKGQTHRIESKSVFTISFTGYVERERECSCIILHRQEIERYREQNIQRTQLRERERQIIQQGEGFCSRQVDVGKNAFWVVDENAGSFRLVSSIFDNPRRRGPKNKNKRKSS